MFTPVICMHARSIIYSPAMKRAFRLRSAFVIWREGEREMNLHFVHNNMTTARATLRLVASFELSSPDAAFSCLFVQQQQVYKLILDRPL